MYACPAGQLGGQPARLGATTDRQRRQPLASVDTDSVPYFSLALLPSPVNAASAAHTGNRYGGAAAANPRAAKAERGEVTVVGLGPADREWLTPQALAALVWAALG